MSKFASYNNLQLFWTTLKTKTSLLLSQLNTDSTTIVDGDTFVATKSGTAGTYYKKSMSALWAYICNKLKSDHNYLVPIESGGTGATSIKSALSNLHALGTFSRTDIGDTPNYDDPGVNGVFEIRPASDISGATGTRPSAAYMPILSVKTPDNIAMLQLAGNSAGIYFRGVQKASATLSGIAWQRIVTNSGTWAISTSGNAATATKATTADKWTTARNIYIADSDGTNTGAAVSVNGSANATLKLPSTIKASLTGNASTASSAAKWTTARNISIADSSSTNTGTAVSVDGSANKTLLLPATIKATLTGNASTATSLQTARTINGTSFNGTANITTANWGTARNIYIADSSSTNKGAAVSVNGSADKTLLLPTAIKASLTGNASTATTLQTARTINGTSFNGGADITTANWGTARNISIADATAANTGAAVSVNGSGNVTLKLPAIIKATITGNAATASALAYTTAASNNKSNYPWHRFAYVKDKNTTYNDIDAVFLIRYARTNSNWGIIKCSYRTNNSGAATQCTLHWLVRYGMAEDSVQYGKWGLSGTDKTYCDLFIKCGTYSVYTIQKLSNGYNAWTMVNSAEVSDTTSTDRLTSAECYSSLSDAATQLHGGTAYTATGSAVDVGEVNKAKTATNATAANKLLLSKTIWGQAFDGTANVTGNMTDVGTINNAAYINQNTAKIGCNSVNQSVLRLWGTTYGNNSNYITTSGKLSYGDGGPQIQFGTSSTINGGDQSIALVYTDNDTIASGASLSLVSNQTAASFIAPTIKALTGFNGNLTGNVTGNVTGNLTGTASKATADASGNTIASTYIKGLSISGKTITYTKGNGTTGTITTQDTTYGTATTSAAGLMSGNDKSKLDGIATGAEVNQNALAKITVGTTTLTANAKQSTLTIANGTGISLALDTTNSKLTISHANNVTAGTVGTSSATSGNTLAVPYVTYNAQGHITGAGTHTHTVTGFLTSHANGFGKITYSGCTIESSSANATLTLATSNIGAALDTTNKKLTLSLTKENVSNALGYTPPTANTDTHYTTGIIAGASGATANSAQTNPYVAVKDNTTYRSQIRLVGGGATTVKSDASGNITISSTDNNTDTKVTAVGNHYTPTGGDTLSASGTTAAAWGTTSFVTGIIKDAAGHVTGITSGKFPTNPNTNNIVAYCSTAGGTAAKVASHTGFVLRANSYIYLTLSTANTAASALTLNINNTGAKSIYINGAASSSSNYTLPAGTYLVKYNGTAYYFRTDDYLTTGNLVGNVSGTANNVTGTVAVNHGGTGRTTLTSNAVLTGNTTSAVNMVTTANGALYATSSNGAAKFGTLPIAQGGTGKTSAIEAAIAFGLGASLVRSKLYPTIAVNGSVVTVSITSTDAVNLQAYTYVKGVQLYDSYGRQLGYSTTTTIDSNQNVKAEIQMGSVSWATSTGARIVALGAKINTNSVAKPVIAEWIV